MPEKYIVQQGDCIHSIAFERGFFPETLWNHADNKSLKDLRKDPHVLLPGDIVTIPDKRLKEVSKPAEKKYSFKRKGVPKEMKVQLKQGDDPMANMPCKIKLAERELELTSDGDGWLKIPIPPNVRSVVVQLESGDEFELMVGELDPVDQISGVQGRLAALGFYDDPIDNQLNEQTRSALKRFQSSQKLKVSGEPDDPTQKALVKLVGS